MGHVKIILIAAAFGMAAYGAIRVLIYLFRTVGGSAI